jgi:hypothetical protein
VDDYQSWAAGITWTGSDPSVNADPNSDGATNLMSYALQIPPLAAAPAGHLPFAEAGATQPGGPWLGLTFRKNAMAADLTYTVRTSTDLVSWTDLTANGSTIVEETVNSDPDGDGNALLQRVRVMQNAGETRRFLALRVSR